jgi:uncharacterized protein YndB with AHSA1/START domain
MTDAPYGTLTEPATLTMERLLPGPIERVWTWLTDSDHRRRWLAAGPMDLTPGGTVALTWRNDDLTTPPGTRPAGMGAEHSMTGRVIAADPPHHLSYDWPGVGEVSFDLAPQGDQVRLRLTHRRIPDAGTRLGVSAGWHAHLDLLAAGLAGLPPAPHWDNFSRLRDIYRARLAG